jgi:hypothetical protein
VIEFAGPLPAVFPEGSTASLAVRRVEGSDGNVSVNFATVEGSAFHGLDLLAALGTLAWADGETGERQIEVTLLEDAFSESDEDFLVELSNPTGGAVLGDPAVALVIVEDTTPTETCVEDGLSLCLLDDRFLVRSDFRTPQGGSVGVALPMTSDTGAFVFFDPANVEVIVKMVDACAPPFDRFWVFAAGLTNVEVRLTITDTVSGEVRTYTNPQSTPFQPIQDTNAFATCP